MIKKFFHMIWLTLKGNLVNDAISKNDKAHADLQEILDVTITNFKTGKFE